MYRSTHPIMVRQYKKRKRYNIVRMRGAGQYYMGRNRQRGKRKQRVGMGAFGNFHRISPWDMITKSSSMGWH